ncbi:UDP-glycosyltransferase UGT5-like [Periplaneta americana]|uniref:UDP-glycosyltransferase UGT5-like n=1 Tax=Periplaneta americana TaxID=6978 RepID=UPI0037E90B15
MTSIRRLMYVGAALLVLQSSMSEAAKILSIFPFQAKSHVIVNTALMEELVSRGHEVTVLSLHPRKTPLPNYTDIVLKTSIQDFFPFKGNNTLLQAANTGLFEMINIMLNASLVVCDYQLQEEVVQKLIHSTDIHFDAVIVEAFFNECFLGFAHKFKAPLIQICTYGGSNFMGEWVGNPTPYAIVPDPFLNLRDKMNFWERTANAVFSTIWKLTRNYYYLPGQDAIMKKHFNHLDDLPSLSELEYKTSLLLINHHFSISYPRPLMPNFVQVGGMHVKPPKPLPQDLRRYLDEAKDGVIYFSMGSNIKSSDMTESQRNAFLEAFSKLKQRVLWKWETDSMPGQPDNVKLEKWLPQPDILAHKNVLVFMTHGGLLSTQEAINRGVPVLGIPVFGDQKLNMAWAESAGVGVTLQFDNISSESITSALNEILGNPRYRENAQSLSRIYRDQPLTPLEQAVFWTEYVIRHKGAPHMRSAALDLAWYQYFLLDVIAFLVLAVGSVLLIVFLVLRAVFRKLCSGSKEDKISHKKKD